jgi:hypothetical protein
VLAESMPPSGPAAIVREFAEWLDSFDFNSIVELDLGGMSAMHWDSDMRRLLDECVTALADDDADRAQEAFVTYMREADAQQLIAHSN